MNDLLVITACTGETGTLSLYRRQLADANIDFYVEPLEPFFATDFGATLTRFRNWSTKFAEYERLVFSDGFDVLFYGTREDVISKIPMDHVLMAAEKNCYPDSSIAQSIIDRYPDRGPHCFANGGLLAGTPKAIYEWSDNLEKHPLYLPCLINQGFYNTLLAEGSDLCRLDYTTSLLYCLYPVYAELEFEKGLPVNTLYGTHPHFLHANGRCPVDEMLQKYERSLQ